MNLDELAVQGQVVADGVLEGAEAVGKGHKVCVGEASGQQTPASKDAGIKQGHS